MTKQSTNEQGHPSRQNTESDQNKEEPEIAESEEERKFFNALKGPDYFKRYLIEAKNNGINKEEIIRLIRTKKAQEKLRGEFITFFRIFAINDPKRCLVYIKEWKELDIDVSSFINLQEVNELLEHEALEIKIAIYGTENPNVFLKFVDSWKMAGVDLSGLVHTRKALDILENIAVSYKIAIYGTENPNVFLKFVDSWKMAGVDLSGLVHTRKALDILENIAVSYKIAIYGTENPNVFLKFVDSWKMAGVDLSGLVNTERVREILDAQSKYKLKNDPRNFKAYVQSWIMAGWKPSPELMNTFDKF